VVVPLDSWQASITRRLLTETGPATVQPIAGELKLTSRVVRYNLPSIETFLRPEGLRVVRRRGAGVRRRRSAARDLGDSWRRGWTRARDGEDRKPQVLAALLDAPPRPVHTGDLEGQLGVSRPTVRRDVRAAESWLEGHHLHCSLSTPRTQIESDPSEGRGRLEPNV
jgi:transcriptional antiterminator